MNIFLIVSCVVTMLFLLAVVCACGVLLSEQPASVWVMAVAIYAMLTTGYLVIDTLKPRVPDSPMTGYAEQPGKFYLAPDGRWYAEPTLAEEYR